MKKNNYEAERYKYFLINIELYGRITGAPERIRTSNRPVRSRVLYPIELPVLELLQ